MSTFSRHLKAVTRICYLDQDENLFLSVSLDSTAKIWEIQSNTLHYTFQLVTGLSYVDILRQGKELVCGRNDSIITLDLHIILEKFMGEVQSK